jgi:hypothetical protein
MRPTNSPLNAMQAEVWLEIIFAERRDLYPSAERVEELLRRHPESEQRGRPITLAARERGCERSAVHFPDTPIEPEEPIDFADGVAEPEEEFELAMAAD